MHSTYFTALAQAADDTFGRVVVAMSEIPPSPGTYPAAWVLLSDAEEIRDIRPFTYSVHRAIFPEHTGNIPFFDRGHYDLDYPEAMARFVALTTEEVRLGC